MGECVNAVSVCVSAVSVDNGSMYCRLTNQSLDSPIKSERRSAQTERGVSPSFVSYLFRRWHCCGAAGNCKRNNTYSASTSKL